MEYSRAGSMVERWAAMKAVLMAAPMVDCSAAAWGGYWAANLVVRRADKTAVCWVWQMAAN